MVDGAVACPACGYDLRAHLDEHGARCPECGRWFSKRAFQPRATLLRASTFVVALVGSVPGVLAMILSLAQDRAIAVIGIIAVAPVFCGMLIGWLLARESSALGIITAFAISITVTYIWTFCILAGFALVSYLLNWW